MPDTAKLSAALAEIGARFGARPGDVERLLAAVDAVLELAGEWKAKSAELWEQVSIQDCDGASAGFKGIGATMNSDHSDALAEAISRALLGKESPDA
jgi:hypothetical protein